MNKVISILLLLLALSCQKSGDAVGEFLYMDGNLVHSKKDCRDAEVTTFITRSSDVFQFLHKYMGEYYWNSGKRNSWEVKFCGSCISESMMIAIEDSIAKYDYVLELSKE